jgi:DNA-directed RNA polymerase specialized sigma24 family protein
LIGLVAKEVMYHWNVPHATAAGFVLSAIGEPATLLCIYNAWRAARRAEASFGLPKVIIRRRVIDLLRKEARPRALAPLTAIHESDATRGSAADRALSDLDTFHGGLGDDPRGEVELRQATERLLTAMACFASQGESQRRQAQLLRRYVLDDVNYAKLSAELSCTENACRVRVHKARLALRKHIRECHSELQDWLV